MMRGLLGPMEKHHAVRIADEALVAVVTFSQRYIPAPAALEREKVALSGGRDAAGRTPI